MDGSKMDQFWEDSSGGTHGHGHGQHLSYERNLNFSTVAVDDNEYGYPKKKTVRDPLSHRIIEKRRRDRMNNCLADLARLLPPSSLRKGRGRIEKTEIVELAIKHLRHLQCHPCPHSDNCEYNQIPIPRSSSSSHTKPSSITGSSPSSISSGGGTSSSGSAADGGNAEYFRLGFQESLSETMHFLVECEGMYAGDDLCVRLVKHLNKHCDTLLRDQFGNKRKLPMGFSRPGHSFKKEVDGSLSSGYQPNGSSGSGSEGNLTNDGDMSSSYGPKTFPLPPLSSTAHSSTIDGRHGGAENLAPFDYEGDQNSCSSAQLSIEISDAFSVDGKSSSRQMVKPPIPTIICSHSSSNNSGSPPVNSSNSDEGNSTKDNSPASSHRYKFKNRIKQRFEDLQTGEHHRQSISRQSPYDSNNPHGDSDSPDFQPQSPETGIMTGGSDCEKFVPNSEVSGQSVGSQQQSTHPVKEKCDSKEECSEATNNAPATEESKHDEKANTICIEDATNNCNGNEVIDEKPNLADLHPAKILSAAGPIIASMAGLQEAKALAVRGGNTVPAFALHDKGYYYVPLTLDKSLVAPMMEATEKITQPPLHPVTISVCFLISPEGKPVSPDIPIIPPTLPAAVVVPVPLVNPPPHHIPLQMESPRETHNFIMNRFAQSQVPMMFAGNSSLPPAKNESTRYPFSICGSSGSGSLSSHAGGGSVGSNSDQQVKFYHHISNSNTTASMDSSPSNYYSRSGANRSSGCPDGGKMHSPQGSGSSNGGGTNSSGSSSSRNGRKRSVSISPSVSIGYHSWNEKSHSDDIYMSPPVGSSVSSLIPSHTTDVVNERSHHQHQGSLSRKHSSQPHPPSQHHHQHHGHYPSEVMEGHESQRREKRDRESSIYLGMKRVKKSRPEEEVGFSPTRHSVPSN